jgi:HD superfamily phosphohydrolase
LLNIQAALYDGFTEPVRDALWGHIYLTEEIEELTRGLAFNRLHRVSQLGPAKLCYPGATHTRAAHSLGVYHLARRLLLNLAERGAAPWLSFSGSRSFLCAALLHDIGHFPYAHSLKELLTEHETLSARAILAEPLASLVGAAGGEPAFAAAIVDTKLPARDCAELLFYRKLLSGCLDVDKLDYLNRDARYCGVPYGAQDVDFIFSILYPHPVRGVDIDSRGIPSVESVLFSKYLMYRSVYWHHSVRAATAMVKKALLGGLSCGAVAAEELYGLDDEGLFTLLAAKKKALFSPALDVREGRLYQTAVEFPYDPAKHACLDDISRRADYERALAGALSSALGGNITENEVIIDLPERCSFESSLRVKDDNTQNDEEGKTCPFSEKSSIFYGEAAETFARALRVVRVFIDRRHEKLIKSEKVSEHIENILHKDGPHEHT